MTTINTIEDLARILEEHPRWAQALRALILSQELMDLPGRFENFVQEQQAFNQEQKTFNESITTFVQEQRDFNERTDERFNALQGSMDNLQGSVDNLKGPTYEMKTASNLRSLLRQHLGLRNARMLKGPNRETDEEFAAEMDKAQESGSITEEELNQVFLLDVIAQARAPDGRTVYAAIEVSVTVDERDVTRARDRAEVIRRATGAPAEPVVIGESTDARAAGMIGNGEARLVIYPYG